MENALRVNMYRAFSNDEKQTIKANDKSKRQTINTNDNDKQKTAKEYAILEYLGRVDKAKTVDIAAVIGLGPDRTRVILASMAKRNMIVAEGANRNRIYRLPQTINWYNSFITNDINGCTLVAKSHKSKKIDGINVKPQQHIATKENQFRKILMPFKRWSSTSVLFRSSGTDIVNRLQVILVVACSFIL